MGKKGIQEEVRGKDVLDGSILKHSLESICEDMAAYRQHPEIVQLPISLSDALYWYPWGHLHPPPKIGFSKILPGGSSILGLLCAHSAVSGPTQCHQEFRQETQGKAPNLAGS